MNLKEFSKANRERIEAADGFNCPLSSWSTSEWFIAVLGELGEAANVSKKLNRYHYGWRDGNENSHELKIQLAKGLADTFIYLDLLAQSLEVDLSEEVPRVFDEKSRVIGYVAR